MKLKSSQRGKVYLSNRFVGWVQRSEGIYSFTYDLEYLKSDNAQAISLTLPLRKEPFQQKTMIPFFDGLIPEGWLLEIISDNWKINRNDRMSLLLLACRDCIGNVSIVAEDEEIDRE